MAGLRTILCSVLVLAVAGSSTSAQTKLLTGEFRGISATVRSGAPVSLECTLTYHGTGLLEGALVLRVHDGQQQLAQMTIEDIVLTTGEQSFRVMLPAEISGSQYQQAQIHAGFVGNNRTIGLVSPLLRLPTAFRRSCVNCICFPPERRPSPERERLIKSLRIEQFKPAAGNLTINTVADHTINTFPAHVPPGEMPTDPHYYCSFDLVLLADEGFSQLREKQLRAVVEWVDAGGSLCVVPSGPLSAFHVKTLNELVGGRGAKTLFTRDATGRLLSLKDNPSSGIWLAQKSLGRVAVVETVPDAANGGFESRAWKEAVAFLWKIRHDQPVAQRGRWANRNRQGLEKSTQQGDDMLQPQQMTLQPIQSLSGLMGELMPKNVRVVPLSLLGLMLFLYVLAVGPADYFLLGFFRQRKLTWILFPIVTVGFTLFTVWTAHAYMAVDQHRRSVVFVDVGDDGRVVRENRFELLFTGTPQTMTTDVERGIFSPLDHQRFGTYGYRNYYRNSPGMVGRPEYRGRMPLRYSATQQLPQWTPQLNRLLTISPKRAAVDFDWDLKLRFGTAQGRQEVADRVLKAFGRKANVYLLHRDEVHTLAQSRQLFSPTGGRHDAYDSRVGSNFLKDACVRPPLGLFGVVSQVSPSGGNHFEDLSILDASDERQWLLVVAVEREGDLLIYRRLYTGED